MAKIGSVKSCYQGPRLPDMLTCLLQPFWCVFQKLVRQLFFL